MNNFIGHVIIIGVILGFTVFLHPEQDRVTRYLAYFLV
jgi:hypothetical protein